MSNLRGNLFQFLFHFLTGSDPTCCIRAGTGYKTALGFVHHCIDPSNWRSVCCGTCVGGVQHRQKKKNACGGYIQSLLFFEIIIGVYISVSMLYRVAVFVLVIDHISIWCENGSVKTVRYYYCNQHSVFNFQPLSSWICLIDWYIINRYLL